jgi:hypothetical protein
MILFPENCWGMNRVSPGIINANWDFTFQSKGLAHCIIFKESIVLCFQFLKASIVDL